MSFSEIRRVCRDTEREFRKLAAEAKTPQDKEYYENGARSAADLAQTIKRHCADLNPESKDDCDPDTDPHCQAFRPMAPSQRAKN